MFLLRLPLKSVLHKYTVQAFIYIYIQYGYALKTDLEVAGKVL